MLALIAVVAWTIPAQAGLQPVSEFGANPGALAMYEYVPAGLATGKPIVVVLHGCTQTAAAMESAGWNALADELGFAVIYPEQQTANNPVRCFNWAGEYGDTMNLERGKGENQSIISMVDKAIVTHGSDPDRVYIVGFSAGAAFTAVMLATWPERFAAGAIMSGLPYRCATSVNGAFSCQNPGTAKSAAQWGDFVRAAADGPYPRVQLWQGAADTTVAPMNQGELIKQWTNAHGTDADADATETIGKATRTEYRQGTTVVVEAYSIATMGHAIVIGGDACPGAAAAYFSDQGICSTARAAAFFELTAPGGGGGSGSGSGSGSGAGSGSDDSDPGSCNPAGGCSTGGAGGGLAIVLAALLRRRWRRPTI
ncbi:MAG: PHB depolymerase family esterase [Kofleriaceae bacterium]